MNYQKENQTSQLDQDQDRPPAPPLLLMPPVLYRSIANELIYDDTLQQVQNLTDLPVIYRSTANERIYDDDVILSQVQDLTGLPQIYRTIANERIYDDDLTLHQLVQEDDVSNNLSHRYDILDLSQEMTYMGIEPP
jgi:hypothetical protein